MTEFVESVSAESMLVWIVEGSSVRRMRETGLGSDFDIFEKGEVRDIMRLEGAGNV